MSDNLTPDAEKSVQYLRWLLGSTTVHIEYMVSERKAPPTVCRIPADDTDKLKKLISSKNSETTRFNMYWVPDGGNFKDGKRLKANLESVRFLHVDLDFKDYPGTPDEQHEKVRLLLLDSETRPDCIPEPTIVWMTGGGYQALWMLDEPVSTELGESANLALLEDLEGGPGTHDPGRLLRLVGSTNWLNDKKRAEGRSPVLGYIASPKSVDDPPKQYSINIFRKAERTSKKASTKSGPKSKKLNLPTIIPASLPSDPLSVLPDDPDWRQAIAHGKPPPGKGYSSRSELMFACTVWMLSQGIHSEVVLGILLAPSLAIGDHIRDRYGDANSALNYAQRQIRRVKETLDLREQDWPVTNDKMMPMRDDPHNVRYALTKLGVAAYRNEFSGEDEIEGGQFEGRDIADIAEILSSQFGRKLEFKASPASIRREILSLAHENRFHPILDYLNSLEWDGVRRLDTWLVNYCGVDDTPLHREFAAKTMIAAVRRINQPGIKFDTMLVLEGRQGIGKSTLLRVLAVDDAWFCESLNLRVDDRERAQILARAWIVECQELDGLNKLGSENLKKFLSESIDTYRKPYDRNAQQFPRHCIIVGTTNETDYLRDFTGNRRFWPVKVKKVDLKGLAAVVDQLWAEAAHREAEKEPIVLTESLWRTAEEAQRERLAEDPFADVLRGALGDGPGKVSMQTVKKLLDLQTPRLSGHDSRRIKAVLEEQGWQHGTFQFWVDVRGERRAGRGFMRGGDADKVQEFAVRKRRDGSLEVGEISKSGSFMPVNQGMDDSEMPF